MATDITFTNPLGLTNIGDPYILRTADGRYYCYPTCADDGFKAWVSDDLIEWEDAGCVFRRSDDAWARGKFWAPEVVELENRFYLFYTAAVKMETGGQRIGLAVSDCALGPFVDVDKDRPFIDPGYCVIDANVLIDADDRKYIYFTRDVSTNIVNSRHESHIYGAELADDLKSLKHEPRLLLTPGQAWETRSGPDWVWLEGSFTLKRNETYYLMYSANFYASRDYAVGYATSDSPLGPFEKYQHNPVMRSNRESISGTGHNSVTLSPDGSELLVVYHAHTDPNAGGGNRRLHIDRMGFGSNGELYVNGPTDTVQPVPSGSRGFRNIAPEAHITVSSIQEGSGEEGLTDGVLGFDPRSIRNDWCSRNESAGAWVRLEWELERQLSGIFIYNSYAYTRRVRNATIEISDGQVMENLAFSHDPETPAFVELPACRASWIRITITDAVFSNAPAGLSQVIVLGV